MPTARHTKVLIIGSGPAGYTAAIYAARAMLSPVLIQGTQPGGQLTITTEVENWPGDTRVQGPELMTRMEEHAAAMGAELLYGTVSSLDLSQRPFIAEADDGSVFTADAIILATGAQAKWLGIPGESELQGAGVSACATCDGFFFRDKDVVVVGGGNTAVEEALFLTNFARKVFLIHRRNTLRAERVLQERLFAHPKIEVIWDHEPESILGDSGVTGIRLRHVADATLRTVPCDGVFVAIGHAPASDLVKDQLDLHEGGYVKVLPGTTQTSVEGVFAAGDLTDHVYRQAITSAGMGCMAALDAERWLSAKTGA